ncbi:MAG: hypothetical protein Edafosvirus24_11 [Edafosvirus sp.]|uniref:Uncharacterized protein n=1 Tax=Edafosvirus sp. TaxID=2487765 RepID=A0A3G4ZUW2_9VIRU|nr:MAG: hypothetical protein Edafosvirus24_11 [Edafosvirus sp.]
MASIKIPPRIPPTKIEQTLDDYKKDKSRRIPTSTNCKIKLYWWEPKGSVTKPKLISNIISDCITTCMKYYPLLTFVHDATPLILNDSKETTERYRRQIYYKASALLNVLPTESAFAHVCVTSTGLVGRPGILTNGLARRETGVACFSTANGGGAKILVHELAHLFGLRHCSDTSCIMKAGEESSFKKLIDKNEPSEFCDICQSKLAICFNKFS